MTWTEAKIEQLRQLWADGYSASQCASQLGGVSRNAVVGKVHRLGLSGRVTRSRKPHPPRIRKRSRPSPTGIDALRAIRMAGTPLPPPCETDIARVSFVELDEDEHRHCKWPVGNWQDQHTPHYCGAQRVPGLPYCPNHARRAYAPVPPRRPAPAAPVPADHFADVRKNEVLEAA